MTDEERKQAEDRLYGLQAGLDLAIQIIKAEQRHKRRYVDRIAAQKKDTFDKFIDIVTLDWLFK